MFTINKNWQISRTENLTQNGEIMPGEQATFGMQGNAIKEEPCDQYSSYCCQLVDGATSDKDVRTEYVDEKTIKTECEDLVHDDIMQISEGSTSECLTVWKAEKHEKCEANFILENGIDRKGKISEVAAVKKEQCDHLIVSDSSGEDDQGVNGDEMVKLLTRRSDCLTAKLRAVCKELKKEGETRPSTWHTDNTRPMAESYSVWAKVESETGSEKNDEGNPLLCRRRAPHTDVNGFQEKQGSVPGDGQKRKLISINMASYTTKLRNMWKESDHEKYERYLEAQRIRNRARRDEKRRKWVEEVHTRDMEEEKERERRLGRERSRRRRQKTAEKSVRRTRNSKERPVRKAILPQKRRCEMTTEERRLHDNRVRREYNHRLSKQKKAANRKKNRERARVSREKKREHANVKAVPADILQKLPKRLLNLTSEVYYGDSHAKELDIDMQTVDKLRQRTVTEVGEVNHPGPLAKSHDIFSCDKCYLAFSEPAYLLKHMRRIHHCGYCEQRSNSKTTERTHETFHGKESNTAIVRSSGINNSIPAISNVKNQRLETENLKCIISLPRENHLTELNTTRQVAQDGNEFSIPDIKQFQSIPICSKTCDEDTKYENSDNKYENSDSGSRLEHDHLHLSTRLHTGEKSYKCGVCDVDFPRRSHLQVHKRIHTGEKPYMCDVCGVGSARRSHLQVHKRIHTGEKPYKCDICGVGFVQLGNLKYHTRKHTGEKPYKCDVCDVGFPRRSHLQVHKRKHTGEKPYKCNVCDVGFARRSHLQVHKRIHTGEKPYKCDVCGVGFVQTSQLKVHKRIHTGEKPYKCEVCGVGFVQTGQLKVHKRIHTGEKPYKCDVCGVGFADKSALQVHKRKHTGEKPYKCDVGFVHTRDLLAHKRIHTGEKPYKCDVCAAGFAQAGHLQRHKTIHSGEKPYKCDVCDVGFSKKDNLLYHKRIHSGEKVHKCDVCDLGFVHAGELKAHKGMHTGEKSYKCNICDVSFAHAHHLKVHQRRHTREKPYKCDVCGVGFARKGYLKVHQRRHTGEKPYQCDVCGVDFACGHNLQRHQRKHST